MCQRLKFLVERLIKVGHLKRYVREVDREAKSGPPTNVIIACAVTSSETRTTINYILGGSFDNRYQSKRQQRKLLREAMVKAWVNSIHTGGSREET